MLRSYPNKIFEGFQMFTIPTQAAVLLFVILISPAASMYAADANEVLHLAFDENTGATKAADSSGKGNNGTLMDSDPAAAWVTGKLGNALNFEGINDYVDCGTDPSLQLTGDLTLSIWIKPTSVEAKRQTLISKGSSPKTSEFCLILEPSGQLSYYHHQAGRWQGAGLLAEETIQSGTWQHIAITRDAATRTLKGYYNGELKTTLAYPEDVLPMDNADPVMIGNGVSGAFTGQMDDVRIYSRSLDWPEISALSEAVQK